MAGMGKAAVHLARQICALKHFYSSEVTATIRGIIKRELRQQRPEVAYYPGIKFDVRTLIEGTNAGLIVGVDPMYGISDAEIEREYCVAILACGVTEKIEVVSEKVVDDKGETLTRFIFEFAHDGRDKKIILYRALGKDIFPSELKDGYDIYFERGLPIGDSHLWMSDAVSFLREGGLLFLNHSLKGPLPGLESVKAEKEISVVDGLSDVWRKSTLPPPTFNEGEGSIALWPGHPSTVTEDPPPHKNVSALVGHLDSLEKLFFSEHISILEKFPMIKVTEEGLQTPSKKLLETEILGMERTSQLSEQEIEALRTNIKALFNILKGAGIEYITGDLLVYTDFLKILPPLLENKSGAEVKKTLNEYLVYAMSPSASALKNDSEQYEQYDEYQKAADSALRDLFSEDMDFVSAFTPMVADWFFKIGLNPNYAPTYLGFDGNILDATTRAQLLAHVYTVNNAMNEVLRLSGGNTRAVKPFELAHRLTSAKALRDYNWNALAYGLEMSVAKWSDDVIKYKLSPESAAAYAYMFFEGILGERSASGKNLYGIFGPGSIQGFRGPLTLTAAHHLRNVLYDLTMIDKRFQNSAYLQSLESIISEEGFIFKDKKFTIESFSFLPQDGNLIMEGKNPIFKIEASEPDSGHPKHFLCKWNPASQSVAYDTIATRVTSEVLNEKSYGVIRVASALPASGSWAIIEYVPNRLVAYEEALGLGQEHGSFVVTGLDSVLQGSKQEVGERLKGLGKIFAVEYALGARDCKMKHILLSETEYGGRLFRIDWEHLFDFDEGTPDRDYRIPPVLGGNELEFMRLLRDKENGEDHLDMVIEGFKEGMNTLADDIGKNKILKIIQENIQDKDFHSIKAGIESKLAATDRGKDILNLLEGVRSPVGAKAKPGRREEGEPAHGPAKAIVGIVFEEASPDPDLSELNGLYPDVLFVAGTTAEDVSSQIEAQGPQTVRFMVNIPGLFSVNEAGQVTVAREDEMGKIIEKVRLQVFTSDISPYISALDRFSVSKLDDGDLKDLAVRVLNSIEDEKLSGADGIIADLYRIKNAEETGISPKEVPSDIGLIFEQALTELSRYRSAEPFSAEREAAAKELLLGYTAIKESSGDDMPGTLSALAKNALSQGIERTESDIVDLFAGIEDPVFREGSNRGLVIDVRPGSGIDKDALKNMVPALKKYSGLVRTIVIAEEGFELAEIEGLNSVEGIALETLTKEAKLDIASLKSKEGIPIPENSLTYISSAGDDISIHFAVGHINSDPEGSINFLVVDRHNLRQDLSEDVVAGIDRLLPSMGLLGMFERYSSPTDYPSFVAVGLSEASNAELPSLFKSVLLKIISPLNIGQEIRKFMDSVRRVAVSV